MMPLAGAAAAVFVAWNSFVTVAQDTTLATAVVPAAVGASAPLTLTSGARDSLPPVQVRFTTPRPSGLGYLAHLEPRIDSVAPGDTVRKPRQKAFSYSEGYAKRLTIHRRMSWAMLPLFAVSYFSGDQILKKSKDAPSWARNVHGPAATGSALLFTANTVTGAWNLWEGRHDPNGRTKKILHSVLFTAASAGFVYAGTKLANDAEQSQAARERHRNVALYSMGVSTVSWLIMLVGN